MNSPIINAAPLARLLGIQDKSIRPPVIDPEVLPTHLPHVYLFTEKGPTLPQQVSGDSLAAIYGTKALDTRSKYYNHQSVLASLLLGQGNSMMVQRVLPDDIGPKARLLFSIDIVADDVQQYERNDDNTFERDSNGDLTEIAATTLPGYKAIWVVNQWETSPSVEEFGAVAQRVGSLVNADSEQSTLYPMFEMEVSWNGEYGNNVGMRFVAPTTASASPINDMVADAVKSYLYRLQLVQRSDVSSSANVVKTLYGEQTLDVSFKPDAVDTTTDSLINIEDTLIQSYEDLDSPGTPPTYGPFGRLHVYEDNVKAVLAMIGAAEAPQGLLPVNTMDDTSDYLYMVNPFTGTDISGAPYYTLNIEGPSAGGVVFSDSTTFYAAGASDGTMTFASFDALVANELSNYGSLEAPLLDDALYPQSCIYDTGFTLDTKLAMLTPMSLRKDMYVVLSTQDISIAQNTPAQESSLAISLKSAARNYPESEVYGTPVCRALVVGHSGYLLNSKYKGPMNNLLPLTLEMAVKSAKYMSDGTGYWRPGFGFDVPENNRILLFRGVNVSEKAITVRNKDWTNGLIWVQHYDRRSLFWPATQTVYDDDSSVLNSAITMMACVELEKVAQRTWRDLTGISYLTNDQFKERSNRIITEYTNGRFDSRFVIIPETYYTQQDEQRGYSWSCKIHLYAPSMKSVGTFTIVAHRISDLTPTP